MNLIPEDKVEIVPAVVAIIVSPMVFIAKDRRVTRHARQVAGRGRSVSPVAVKEEGGISVPATQKNGRFGSFAPGRVRLWAMRT